MNSSGMENGTFVAFTFSPSITALIAAAICSIGVYLALGWRNVHFTARDIPVEVKRPSSSSNRHFLGRFIKVAILISTVCITYLVMTVLTKSSSISFSIAVLATSIPFIINRNRENQRIRQRDLAWPEAIDSLVSALQSGIPIPEAVMSLSRRGPSALQPLFSRIERKIMSGEDFHDVLFDEKKFVNSAISDQVFETLILAKSFGGKDSNTALRLLAEFVREDLAVVEEIRTKFGWVKNSAVLATAAPWVLLVLLSTQGSTREAFATYDGLRILTLGIVMTAAAFLWMEKVGALPNVPRALR